MSKGSNRRRPQVSREEYERRWAETFDKSLAARFVEEFRRQEAELIERVGTPAENFLRHCAEPDATGYP